MAYMHTLSACLHCTLFSAFQSKMMAKYILPTRGLCARGWMKCEMLSVRADMDTIADLIFKLWRHVFFLCTIAFIVLAMRRMNAVNSIRICCCRQIIIFQWKNVAITSRMAIITYHFEQPFLIGSFCFWANRINWRKEGKKNDKVVYGEIFDGICHRP